MRFNSLSFDDFLKLKHDSRKLRRIRTDAAYISMWVAAAVAMFLMFHYGCHFAALGSALTAAAVALFGGLVDVFILGGMREWK